MSHSIKARLKDPEHLRNKLKRKFEKGIMATEDTLFHKVTDLVGVRVLHLYQDQFQLIYIEIKKWKIRIGFLLRSRKPKVVA